MAILGFLFFAATLAIAVWAIHITVAPRLDYIVELLSGATVTAPALVPVAQRRRVRRLSPLSPRAELRMLRAAA